jgi:hypothetical protein
MINIMEHSNAPDSQRTLFAVLQQGLRHAEAHTGVEEGEQDW